MNKIFNIVKKDSKFSYSEKLTQIKSLFKSAYDEASKLNSEMALEIDDKQIQINQLNEKINAIKVTQEENKTFMSNLEKFI